jgi:hypothetical protein
MENKQQIEQELQEIGVTIAGARLINPYRVPAGYFSTLPETVLAELRNDAFLQNANTGTYAVPSGYFEGLAANILDKIKTVDQLNEVRAELDEVAPLLNTISRQEIYSLPAGYFANVDFAAKATQKEGKVITLRIARKWMQYAAAAVMAGILVSGAFMFTNDRSGLGDVENGVSSEFNKVSEADLVKYLDNPEHFVAAPAATSLASEAELADVKTNIKNLSDDELNQYLKENAESFETPVSDKE